MRSRNIAVAVALALALGPGCRKKFDTPAPSSPELIALPGAANVNVAGDTVTFEADVPYPAREEIALIADHLRRRGYRPLSRSDYVRGWSDFNGPAEHIYQWMGEWRNKDGHVVTYTLQYRYPATEPPSLSHLFVTASRNRGAGKGLLQSAEVDPKAPPNVNHR